MMVTIDDETLARAVLTFCLDSADAMMYALVKGTGSAASALQLIADSGLHVIGCGVHQRRHSLGTHHQRPRDGFVPWLAGVMAATSGIIAQQGSGRIARLVHSRRHAVDHRPASPLLAQPTERPFTAHRLGLPALPMGQRRSEGAGVMPRAGGYRRLTGRKRLR